jgi:endoglucanase
MAYTTNGTYVPTSTDVGFGMFQAISNTDDVLVLDMPAVGNVAYDLTLTSDCHIQLPILTVPQYQVITLRITQSDGGGYMPSFDDHIQWDNHVVPTFNTLLYRYDVIQFISVGDKIWTAFGVSMDVIENVLVLQPPETTFLGGGSVALAGQYYGATPSAFDYRYSADDDWNDVALSDTVVDPVTSAFTIHFNAPSDPGIYKIGVRPSGSPVVYSEFDLTVIAAPLVRPAQPTVDAIASKLNNTPSMVVNVTPGNDNGSPITKYLIYKGTSPNSGTLVGTLNVTTSTTMQYIDSNVKIGILYFYSAVAYNLGGPSDHSVEDSDTPTGVPVVVTPPPVGSTSFDPTPSPAAVEFFIGNNFIPLGGGNASLPAADVSPADIQYSASKGLTNLRISGRWPRMQKSLRAALDPVETGRWATALQVAQNYGCSLLLEPCHDYGGYTDYSVTPNVQRQFGSTDIAPADFADFWTKFATYIVGLGYTNILGYDLMNEPHDLAGAGATWFTYAQAAITAIRAVDMNTPIYVEGYQWSGAYAWEANNPNIHTLVDPANKLIFIPHIYLDCDSSGSTNRDYGDGNGKVTITWEAEVGVGDLITGKALDENVGPRRMDAFNTWLKKHNLRGAIGELGVMNNSIHWLNALDNTIKYCKQAKIPIFYWAGGRDFAYGKYGLTIQPSIVPSGGEDTVQMAVLAQYTGVPSNLNYYISGPISGKVGVATDPFTLEYRGILKSNVTVTPNDGGMGGTFSPASITFAPGFNAVGTFTYTPGKDGLIKIGATNGGNLIDPVPLGFSTNPDLFTSQINPVTGYQYQKENIYSLRRLVSNYVGPCLQLQRSSDAANKDFYFDQTTGDLDIASINAWAGTDTLIMSQWYDQTGYNRPLGNVRTSNHDGPNGGSSLPASDADKPRFYTSGGPNNRPFLRFNKSRMDCVSPIAGHKGQTVIAVTNPSSASTGYLCSWMINQVYNFFDGKRNYVLYGEPNTPVSLDPGFWHSMAGTYTVGGTINFYRDAALMSTNASVTPYDNMVFTYGKNADGTPDTSKTVGQAVMNLGYFAYYPSWYSGDLCELIIYSNELQPQHLAEWTQSQGYWGVAVPPVAATPILGAVTQNTVAISWTKTNAVDYIPQYAPKGSGNWTSANNGVAVTSNSFTFTGLSSNTAYDFRLESRATVNSYVFGTSISATTAAKAGGAGKPIQYIGSNVAQMESVGSISSSRQFKQSEAIRRQLGYGFNILRLPFQWQYLQPTPFGPLNQTYLNVLLAYAQQILNTPGVVVLLDSHDFGYRNVSGYSGVQYIGYDVLTPAAFADYWNKIANQPLFKNNDRVWFGLENEPAVDPSTWIPCVQTVVDTLRQNGITNKLTLTNKTSNAENVTTDGNDYFTCWKDPLNNYALELHQYANVGRNGGSAITDAGYIKYYSSLYAVRRAAKVRCDKLGVFCPQIVIGEAGFDTGAASLAILPKMLAMAQTHSDDILAITFYSGGDSYPASYIYNMNPVLNGVVDFVNGVAPTTIPFMQSYLPGGDNYGYLQTSDNGGMYSINGNIPVTFSDDGPFPGVKSMSAGQIAADGRNCCYGQYYAEGLTVELWFKMASAPLSSSYFFGSSSTLQFIMDPNGTFKCWYGYSVHAVTPNTTKTFTDNQWHHLQVSVSASGCQVYVDGSLVTSSTTGYDKVNHQDYVTMGLGSNNGRSTGTIFPGSFAQLSMSVGVKNTANFARPTAPRTGLEKDLFFFVPLNGSLESQL